MLTRTRVSLDLRRFFEGRTDYVVLRLGDEFPDYTDYSDVDVLCADVVDFLRHVLTVGAEDEARGFTIRTHATGRQLHVDFYAPGAERLTFRFDLFDTLDAYDAFAIAPSYVADILSRKRVVHRDGVDIFVPDRDDDLALRLCEYVQHRDTRPGRIRSSFRPWEATVVRPRKGSAMCWARTASRKHRWACRFTPRSMCGRWD